MQISFAMLIFLSFSDQISGGRAKVSEGETASGGAPCSPLPWKKASKTVNTNKRSGRIGSK